MGLIEPMALGSALLNGVIPFAPPLALWTVLMGMLGAATLGILLAVPRRRSVALPLRVIRPATAH